jgi:hypothetical protein
MDNYLPNNFENLSKEKQDLLLEYINKLDTIEKKAYLIAKEHLGSSFNVFKSNGYNDWIKNNKK